MTEREAWARLAKGVSSGMYRGGLCQHIPCDIGCHYCQTADHKLRMAGATAIRMRARITRLPNRYGIYKWPLDDDGQRARAAYCRRQVARLTPKRKPAPKRKAKR